MKQNLRIWNKQHAAELAAAIDAAEDATGHQILVSVGSLRRDAVRRADKVALRWPEASIVLCLDPDSRRFEVRWQDPTFELQASQLEEFAEHMREDRLTDAIALLARELPHQPASTELPDIIEN
jgi:hypothetical protein